MKLVYFKKTKEEEDFDNKYPDIQGHPPYLKWMCKNCSIIVYDNKYNKCITKIGIINLKVFLI
jgi:hypothetical protein